jgi:hypothetical protein
MVVYHVRKPVNLFFNVVSGVCCSEYLSTAEFVEEADNTIYNTFIITENYVLCSSQV